MKVGVLGNTTIKKENEGTVEELLTFLLSNGYETVRFNAHTEIDGVDVVLVLGGDGAILHAAVVAAQKHIKIIGINYGTLGFLTEYEKAVIASVAFGSALLTQGALTREEKYCQTLGQILGFKDFIVVTEEEKIKFMLEENPELYYKILPYAQVLGVTDVWEDKFKGLTIEPPSWCVSSDATWFDYYLIHRSLNRSMMMSMARAAASAANSGGGRYVGRSGGGGSFGGFGGGGFGGGGGGIR
jgi:uncharacterized membrane protein